MVDLISAAASAAVQPGAHRFVSHTIMVPNDLSFWLLTVFVSLAVTILFAYPDFSRPRPRRVLEAMVVGRCAVAVGFALLAWIVPFVVLTPNHRESRPIAQVAVPNGSGGIVWVPGHRLPAGVWWPDDPDPS